MKMYLYCTFVAHFDTFVLVEKRNLKSGIPRLKSISSTLAPFGAFRKSLKIKNGPLYSTVVTPPPTCLEYDRTALFRASWIETISFANYPTVIASLVAWIIENNQ